MFISIQNKIIVLLIAFTLLPFVVLKILAFPKVEADVEKLQIRHLSSAGHKQAVLVSNWMRERMTDVLVIADNPYMVNSINLTSKDAEYSEELRYLELVVVEYGYMGAFVCDNKGLVTIATIKESVGRDLSNKDYIKNALLGNPSASSIMPSEVPLVNEFDEKEIGVPTMFVSTPLKNKMDDIIGVVVLRVHAGTLSNMMNSLKFGKTGESYLVNEEGYMISESRFADKLKAKGIVEKRCTLELKVTDPETGELTSGVAQCISGNNGFDGKGYSDYTGITVLGVWHWLPEFKWGIITEIDMDEGYGLAHNLHFIVNAILFVIAFPVILAAYLMGRQVANPILRLRAIAEKLASGEDLSQRIDIQQKDEIGGLADAFNTMVSSLETQKKELTASQMRYKRRIHSLMEGIYECEPGVDGVFTWINQAGAEILGYNTPEEVLGVKVETIYLDLKDRQRLVERLEKDGVWMGFVSHCKKSNGDKFYMERTSNMVRDENGKPILIFGVFRDITERKKLEEELHASEKQHRALLNSISDGVYQCVPGLEGAFTYINLAGAEILGYSSPTEVIGTRVVDIYVNSQDRNELIETLQKEGVCKDYTAFCKKKNGERFIFEVSCSLVRDDSGKPIMIEGIFRDMTDQ
ncbi:MAG: PAS domain S-box protein [Candidatus Scalindua sp.]|jgi:PAS domain S-box-containing protein|nr:PAS domain S-box protein [Candidatus Scalindua sp.]MBT6052339.1 PAS domain S-box protein [Candidatus Scalindua sp.]MBT6561184.1 PAS domain S-box protein [Candidatus Scalindua sp.]MBT7213387.1 PAS domain S-box protein [Candidatus Scalindua sp.]MBT7591851.1 PAS domain S-box protein [Candidatus Scalindua sp.]